MGVSLSFCQRAGLLLHNCIIIITTIFYKSNNWDRSNIILLYILFYLVVLHHNFFFVTRTFLFKNKLKKKIYYVGHFVIYTCIVFIGKSEVHISSLYYLEEWKKTSNTLCAAPWGSRRAERLGNKATRSLSLLCIVKGFTSGGCCCVCALDLADYTIISLYIYTRAQTLTIYLCYNSFFFCLFIFIVWSLFWIIYSL